MASKTAEVVAKGGLLGGILVEGSSGSAAATQANLKSWISSTSSPNTWLLDSVDPQAKMEDYFDVSRDAWIIIDLKTMKLVQVKMVAPNESVQDLMKLLNQ